MEPRALLVSPEPPYPLMGGGALRTASVLEFLRKHFRLDLITFRPTDGADPRDSLLPRCDRLLVINLPAHARHPAARAARNLGRLIRNVPPLIDRFAGFGAEVKRFLSGNRYACAVLEHMWVAPYQREIFPFADRVILDLHNIESQLARRCGAAARWPESFLHAQFADLYYALERHWLPQFDRVLMPSDEDAQKSRAIAPGTDGTVYPNALPWYDQPDEAKLHSVVFSGNLEYLPNIQAVRFFAAQVWPVLRERWPQLRWRLVGRNPAAVARLIGEDPRVELVGTVAEAVPALAQSQVAVVPLLSGSGTRFKILEAWAAGVPVVSTCIGAEGLPGEDGTHLLLADEPGTFVAAVSRLLAESELRKHIRRAARLLYEQEFTWESAWRKLDWLVDPAKTRDRTPHHLY